MEVWTGQEHLKKDQKEESDVRLKRWNGTVRVKMVEKSILGISEY